MRLTIQYFPDCPNWSVLHERVLAATASRSDVDLTLELVETGSPTLLIDGIDPFAEGDRPVGLSCRLYRTPDGPAGAPTLAQLEEILKASAHD